MVIITSRTYRQPNSPLANRTATDESMTEGTKMNFITQVDNFPLCFSVRRYVIPLTEPWFRSLLLREKELLSPVSVISHLKTEINISR